MRKIVALALTGVLALSMAAVANAGEEIQKEEFTLTKKLPAKKHANAQFVNTITTNDDEALGQPPSATRTVLDLPKQFKINNDDFPKCKTDANGLAAAATPEEAKAACGSKSQVSSDAGSSAVVRTNLAPPFDVIDVDVLAFNEDGDQLLLYSKPTGPAASVPASILVGKLKKFGAINDVSRPAGPYKQSLDVAIPELAAGAIAFFEVTIPKSKYIQAKCKPKTVKAQATTLFSNGGGADGSQPQQSTDDHSVKCKVKK